MPRFTYEKIGRGYSATRRADPNIANVIKSVLGNAASVLNVGAGTGSTSRTTGESSRWNRRP